MKILIICHEFPPIGGGAANATFYLTKDLVYKNHEVTVLTSQYKKRYVQKQNFDIIYLPVLRRYNDRTSPLELLCFALSAILYSLFNMSKKRYDICIVVHGIPSGWVALFINKLFKIPYIISLRGGDVPGFLPQSYNGLHQKVKILTDLYWKNAYVIIANSQGLKEIAGVTGDRLGKQIEVIPNGVDCQLFKPDFSLRNNQTIKIIYTGRITLQKGLECLIEAIKICRKETNRSFNLEIIGDGTLKKYLRDISVDLRNEHILTFTDWLDKKELLIRYEKAHIFILPSLYEGMSNSLLEAMACGCMIIATDITSNKELVKEHENGFLFKPNDTAKLKNILVQTLNSSLEIIESMGNKSRIIAEKYDWDTVTNSYIQYINKAMFR